MMSKHRLVTTRRGSRAAGAAMGRADSPACFLQEMIDWPHILCSDTDLALDGGRLGDVEHWIRCQWHCDGSDLERELSVLNNSNVIIFQSMID